jgi:hypothetical protein
MSLKVITVTTYLRTTKIPVEFGWLPVAITLPKYKYNKMFIGKCAPSTLTPEPPYRSPFTSLIRVKGNEG